MLGFNLHVDPSQQGLFRQVEPEAGPQSHCSFPSLTPLPHTPVEMRLRAPGVWRQEPRLVMPLQMSVTEAGEKLLEMALSRGFMRYWLWQSQLGEHGRQLDVQPAEEQSCWAPNAWPISWATTFHSTGTMDETPVPLTVWPPWVVAVVEHSWLTHAIPVCDACW